MFWCIFTFLLIYFDVLSCILILLCIIGINLSHAKTDIDELMKSGPDTIAVSCPFCVLMIEDALTAKNLNDRVKVKDISELGI